MSKSGIIILAAGASRRLGRSKQLLNLGGEALIHRTCKVALAASFDRVAVVTGAFHKSVEEAIADLNVHIVRNTEWESGMGSSLRYGIEAMKDMDQVLVLLCDQYLITSFHLTQMFQSYIQSKQTVLAAEYEGRFGVPALFDQSVFSQLTQNNTDQGARKLIKSFYSDDKKVAFPLPEASFDIDTENDYLIALDQFSQK